MILTAIPTTALHRVRSAAAYVHDLAQLGLDLLCPCEEGHGARLDALSTPPVATIPAERLAGMVRLDVPA